MQTINYTDPRNQHAGLMMRLISLFRGILCLAVASRCAHAEVLYQNDFTGNAIDPGQFELIIGDTTVGGGYLTMNYHVNHSDGGNTFSDAGVWGIGNTYYSIPVGASGLEFTYRMKVGGTPSTVSAPPKGLVAAAYTVSNGTRSEIDFENLTNGYNGSGDDKCWLNTWRNDKRSVSYQPIAGFDMTAWNTFTIRWEANKVTWLINGTPVRTYSPSFFRNSVPDQPMRIDVSYWKPTRLIFWEAHDSELNNATASASYQSQVDWVDVRTIGGAGAYPTGGAIPETDESGAE